MIREINIAKEQIKNFNLDLTNLTVITECANGFYAYNLFVPVFANAKKIIAVSKTTRYGSYKENKQNFIDIAAKLNIDISNVEIVEELTENHLNEADIVTNTGHVRPITAVMMSHMKNTAVIPLMWETWEFRDEDLDLNSAIKNDILVLGTNETSKEIDMRGYAGVLGLAVLTYLQVEIYKTKVILFGEAVLGKAIVETFKNNGVEFLWFVNEKKEENQIEYNQISQYKTEFQQSDVVLYAEHEYRKEILCEENSFSLKDLSKLNSEIKIGVIAGNISSDEMDSLEISYFPEHIMPPGYMSFQPYHMGARPVIELFASGLKIGEEMSRKRIDRNSLEETIKYMIKESFAMDFINESYMDRYNKVKVEN